MERLALILEDNIIDRTILEDHLKKLNFLCLCAEDAYSALSLIEKNEFDIIFADIKLPFISGLDFIQRIRPYTSRMNIPIFMMSGSRLDKKSVMKSIELGAKEFLVKPLSFEVVKDRIDNKVSLHDNKTHWHYLGDTETSHILKDVSITKIGKHKVYFKSSSELEEGERLNLQSNFLSTIGVNILEICILSGEYIHDIEETLYEAHFLFAPKKKKEKIQKFLEESYSEVSDEENISA